MEVIMKNRLPVEQFLFSGRKKSKPVITPTLISAYRGDTEWR